MIITICGLPGSGKTTVGEAIAAKFNLTFYSMGDIRGKVAQEHGMTINEFNKVGEKEEWTDLETDNKLRELAKDNTVFDSRTAYHFIPNSIKIFLDVDPYKGAKRMMQTERNDEEIGENVKTQVKLIQERVHSDDMRYQKYYNIHFLDKSNYDLWLDTTNLTREQVVNKVLEFIQQKNI